MAKHTSSRDVKTHRTIEERIDAILKIYPELQIGFHYSGDSLFFNAYFPHPGHFEDVGESSNITDILDKIEEIDYMIRSTNETKI